MQSVDLALETFVILLIKSIRILGLAAESCEGILKLSVFLFLFVEISDLLIELLHELQLLFSEFLNFLESLSLDFFDELKRIRIEVDL